MCRRWRKARSDAELFAAAMAGGGEAFAPIVERYQDAVFGVALARLRNFHDAQDVAQQAFVEAFQRLGNLKDPSRLGAWLRSVTIHRSIDFLRRRRETTSVEDDMVPANEPTAPQKLERQELRQRVLAAIGRLSKTQRETTTLFYVNGYTVEDVARIQDVPVGTIKRRLHGAREKLKEHMLVMVEDVLKSEAPKEDFSSEVFQLLQRRARGAVSHWDDIVPDLEAMGGQGIDGFLKAFESPHWRLRNLAVNMILSCDTDENREVIVDLLKRAIGDPNQRVRRMAQGNALGPLRLEEDRKRHEIAPLVVELLFDRSLRVRRNAAWTLLHGYAADVPLDKAVRAMLDERDPVAREWKEHLVRAVLHAQSPESAPVPDRTSDERIDALLASLSDNNSAVRANTARELLELPIDRRRKRERILPVLVGLLSDRAKRVRRRLSDELYPWAADVPVDKVEKALRAETDPVAREFLGKLLRKAGQMQNEPT